MRSTAGSVLISVLWVVLVLSLVTFSLAAAVRVEVASAQQSFDSERAFFLAKGAAEIVFDSYAKGYSFPKTSPVREENGEYIITFDTGEARVRFDAERARARGANILGLLVGYGLATDAAHVTRPSVDGQARTMRLARTPPLGPRGAHFAESAVCRGRSR